MAITDDSQYPVLTNLINRTQDLEDALVKSVQVNTDAEVINARGTHALLGDRLNANDTTDTNILASIQALSQELTDKFNQLNDKIKQATPPSTIGYFPVSTPPVGWLKANGDLVSRTQYADLFAEIGTQFGVGDGSTTFKLPDLRGEFVRAWDDGKGVDTGRELGSLQEDMFKQHVHGIWGNSSAGVTSGDASNYITRIYLNDDSGAAGGTETRPKNIALLACIKY
jgi:microcystin-dependent protein